MEWIDAEKELPKNGDHVIFGKNNVLNMSRQLCKPMTSAGWYMDGFYSYLTKDKLTATHWMPIPVLKNG